MPLNQIKAGLFTKIHKTPSFHFKENTFSSISYVPTSETNSDINRSYGDYWKQKTEIYGGSGKKVRAVIDEINTSTKTKGSLNWQQYQHRSINILLIIKDNLKKISRAYTKLFSLDTCGATVTFVEHGMSDIFITWQHEAYKQPNKFKSSIFANPSVAVIAKNIEQTNCHSPKNLFTP